MSRFLDGPVAGTELTLRRSPIYLRVAVDRATGKVDALDALDDTPRASEDVHAYRAVAGTFVRAFVRPGGCYESADYRHVDVDAAIDLRNTDAWREWAGSQQ